MTTTHLETSLGTTSMSTMREIENQQNIRGQKPPISYMDHLIQGNGDMIGVLQCMMAGVVFVASTVRPANSKPRDLGNFHEELSGTMSMLLIAFPLFQR